MGLEMRTELTSEGDRVLLKYGKALFGGQNSFKRDLYGMFRMARLHSFGRIHGW